MDRKVLLIRYCTYTQTVGINYKEHSTKYKTWVKN